MTKAECSGVLDAQLALSRIGSLLRILSESTDDGTLVDALDMCAAHADMCAGAIDKIPGFVEAQNRKDDTA